MTLSTVSSPREMVAGLRRLLPILEGDPARKTVLPFGIPSLDAHLPDGGLPLGALHDVIAASFADLPAAFGFSTAVLGRLHQKRPIILVTGRSLSEFGHPYYHGLPDLGLDPRRLIWVEAKDGPEALWAIETAVRSRVPAAVIAMSAAELRLHDSQRLHLAARTAQLPLVLLSARAAQRTSAAATRWCIGAAGAARDRFGIMAQWRWRVRLDRCRNGRPGEWLVEWNHVAYRFSLVAALADPALSHGAGTQSAKLRAG